MKNKHAFDETIGALKTILDRHRGERVCVVGTMCCGKTTLVKQLKECNCIDSDDEFWSQASEEEYEFYSQRPFTKEMSDSLHKLFCERVSVKPGFPLFGVYILDCDVVVYLDIGETLLKDHCKRRGDTNFSDVFNLKKWLEDDISSHKTKNDKTFYCITIKE